MSGAIPRKRRFRLPQALDLPAGMARRSVCRGFHGLLLWTLACVSAYLAIIVPLAVVKKLPAACLMATLLAVATASLRLLQQGRIRAAAWLYVLVFWAFTLAGSAVAGGVRSGSLTLVFTMVFAAGWLLGQRTAITLAVISLVATFIMAAGGHAWQPWLDFFPLPPVAAWGIHAVAFILALTTIRHVTSEIRSSLESARRNAQELSEIFASTGDALLVQDEQGRVVAMNERARRLFGFAEGKEVGLAEIAACGEPGSLEETKARLARVLADGSHTFEWRCGPPGGELLWTEFSLRACQIAGERRVIAAIRDINSRKLEEEQRASLERQLQHAQKLESLGRLAGGVAHDFNNLLTVINGYSALISRTLSAKDPLRASVQEIHRAGARAAQLTQQLLTFSRAAEDAEPQPLDLNDLVAAATKMIGRLLGEDIELETRLCPSQCVILADAAQIDQLLLNLAVNARDAMPSGGKLAISTEVEVLSEGNADGLAAGAYVVLTVKDTGTGMDEGVRERLFEPFFTTKGPAKGTGLGLSIAYGVVRRAGGAISVQSAPGSGAAFRILLPQCMLETGSDEAAETETAAGGSETILVVEDQPDVRRFLVSVLEERGYRVLEASNGKSALALLEQCGVPIDLLVTDVIMPHMNGPELAKALAAARPQTKTLLISGYADPVLQLNPEAAKYRLLRKPFSPTTLATVVREQLESRKS